MSEIGLKMMGNNNGIAKGVAVDENGNIGVRANRINNVRDFTTTLAVGAEVIVIDRLDITDFKEIVIGIDAVGTSAVFDCNLTVQFREKKNNRTLDIKNFRFENQAFYNTGIIPITFDTLVVTLKNNRDVQQQYTLYLNLRRG